MRVLEIEPSVNEVTGLPHVDAKEGSSDECWLVARAKSGHHDAFGELYKRHQPRTHRTAFRILRNQQDAEDVVQKSFQRALVNLERFRQDSTFSTWLTRITINEALMLLRQRRTRESHLEDSVDAEREDGGVEVVDHRPTPEQIVCETERRATLLEAIGKLRKKLRVVVHHRELQELTTVQTAQVLGLTVSAVKARTFHARRFLRKRLDQKFAAKGSWTVARKTRARA
jgi:RNA polymerase sigma-70 factor, ECF subfamily